MPRSALIALMIAASGCAPPSGTVAASAEPASPVAAPASTPPRPATPPVTPTPSPRAFSVRLDPAQPLPGREFLVVVEGLGPGEPVELEIVSATSTSTLTLSADPSGTIRLSYPGGAFTRFAVAAKRANGAIVRTESAELAAASPTAAAAAPPPSTVAPSPEPTAAPTAAPTPASTAPPTPATIAPATAAPAAAPTPVPAPTPTPEPTCAPSGGDPARTGVSGIVGLGGRSVTVPQGGVVVEAREGSATGRVLGTATSRSDGRFEILRLPAGAVVFLEVPEQPLFVDALSYLDGTTICADRVVEFRYHLIVMRYITGLNYANGATIPSGATLRWDPVPDVTSYCVELREFGEVRPPPGTAPTGRCPGLNPGWPIGAATSFTLPSMSSGQRITLAVYGYSSKEFLPVAILRGGTYACCDGFHDLTIR